MRAAMNLEFPDRIPVMAQLSIGHMLLQLGVSPVEFWHEMELFADGLIDLRRIYEFDGVLVSLHGHDPDWRRAVVSRRASDDGEVVTFSDGREMLYPPDDLPRPLRVDAPRPDASHEGPLPRTLEYIPVSQGLRFSIHPGHRFDIFDVVRRKLGNDYSLHGEVTSPFDYFLDWYGHQDGLILLIDDPEKSRAVLSHFTDLVVECAMAMCDKDIDAIKISSPFAGGGFISRDFYKTYVLPYESRLAQAIGQKNIPAYLHTCGAIGDRLDLMFDSGIRGIECLDPPPLGNVDLDKALDALQGRGFVKGNIDSVNTLLFKERDEVLSDIQATLEIGMNHRGYILSTACSVAPRVSRENVKLLKESADRWGVIRVKSSHL